MKPLEFFENRIPLIRGIKELGVDKAAEVAGVSVPALKRLAIQAVGDIDFEHYAGDQLYIEMESTVKPFSMNQAQQILDAELERQLGLGRPVRLVHLKPRQYGATTYFCGRIYREMRRKKNRHATTISYSLSSAQHIRGMAERYYDRDIFCGEKTRSLKQRGEKMWKFNDTDCSWMIETAENLQAGHSFSNQILHVSELSRWTTDAETIMRGLTSTVQALPDTMIIVESTANGFGDYFYEMWKQAKDGESTYVPLFISWLQIEKYRMPFVGERTFDGDTIAGFERSLNDDEKKLIDAHGATFEQLHWRRFKIRELKGDVDGFREQYPSTDNEAFLSSGRPYFPSVVVRNQYGASKKESVKKGNLVWVEYGEKVAFEDDDFGLWRVESEPVDGFENRYVTGSDPAEGKSVTEDNKNPDYSATFVYDRLEKKMVAMFKGRVDTDVFEEEIYKASVWYKSCLETVEKNNTAGGALIKGLKNKENLNLYRKQTFGKMTDEETVEYGFYTGKETREPLLSELRRRIKLNAEGHEKLSIPFVEFWDDATSFVIDKTGKPIHQHGAHDDTIFACALALEGASQASETFPIEEEKETSRRSFDSSELRESEEDEEHLRYAIF